MANRQGSMTAREMFDVLQVAMRRAQEDGPEGERLRVLLDEDVATVYFDEEGRGTILFEAQTDNKFTTIWKAD